MSTKFKGEYKMNRKFVYKTKKVCASQIKLELHDNIIRNVEFAGGCSGNTQGIGKLVAGMDVDEVIEKLKGIRCKSRETSCPDQLSVALEAIRNSEEEATEQENNTKFTKEELL